MVFEAHGVLIPCTELLLFNYAKLNTVFRYKYSYGTIKQNVCVDKMW